jgi:VWFA-related protein
MRATLCLLLASAAASGQAPSQQPVFRASSTLVRADVIVTDKDGRRLDGLTAADFIVKERGVLQDVREFVHVIVPPSDRSFTLANPPKERPRQFTNVIPVRGRAFVFMIASVSASHIVQTKQVLTEFLNTLSEEDFVGVSYKCRSDLSQDFTADPALIARAFNRLTEAIGVCPVRPHEWVKNVLLTLDSSRHTRRAIVYVSDTPPFREAKPTDFAFQAFSQELERASRLNIPIYTIDPRGLMAPLLGLDGHMEAQSPEMRKGINQALFDQKQGLKVIAENTNGLAFTDNWNIRDAARTLLNDNSDYYVLGISPQPYKPDGKFHELDIRVRIPGAKVRAREGYFAEPPSKPIASLSGDDALSEGLPGGDLQLMGDAIVENAGIRLALRVQYKDPAIVAKGGDQLAVRWIAIDPDASIKASGQETVSVPAAVPAADGMPIALVVQIPRGRVTIRVLVTSKATGTRGWLHMPLESPRSPKGQ